MPTGRPSHLSIRVDDPNADDRAAARAEGRTRLGGDIQIRGRAGLVRRGSNVFDDRLRRELRGLC